MGSFRSSFGISGLPHTVGARVAFQAKKRAAPKLPPDGRSVSCGGFGGTDRSAVSQGSPAINGDRVAREEPFPTGSALFPAAAQRRAQFRRETGRCRNGKNRSSCRVSMRCLKTRSRASVLAGALQAIRNARLIRAGLEQNRHTVQTGKGTVGEERGARRAFVRLCRRRNASAKNESTALTRPARFVEAP